MLVEPLLPPLVHLMLQVQVPDVLRSLLPGQSAALFLLLLHLLLYLVHVHAPVLLLDHRLMRRSLSIHLTVVLESIECVNFGLVLHDVSLLLGRVRVSLILQSQLPASQHTLCIVQVRQRIDRLDFVLDEFSKVALVLIVLTLPHSLFVDLIVVELSHFQTLLMSHLGTVLIFNLALDQIVESQNIPRVVGLRLDLALGPCLNACLGEVEPVLLVRRQLTGVAYPATAYSIGRRLIRLGSRRDRVSTADAGWITRVRNVHWSMGDRRKHTVPVMGHVDRIVAAEGHAFDAVWLLDSLQQGLGLLHLLSCIKPGPFLGLGREELLCVDGRDRARYDQT